MDRNKILESIYLLLTEQKTVQEELLTLAHRKKDAVVKNNMDALTEIVQLEYAQLSRINNIEKKRNALLLEGWGEKGRTLTVGMLAQEAGDGLKDRFLNIQAELIKLLTKLKESNNENKALVQLQLEYTEMMINFLGASADPLNNFYGTDGKSSDADVTTGSSLFDTEI